MLFYAAVFPVSLIAIFDVCLLVGALWPLRALCIAITISLDKILYNVHFIDLCTARGVYKLRYRANVMYS